MKEIKENSIGFTHFRAWDDMTGGDTLIESLNKNSIAHETVNIEHLVGMAGSAYLLFYASPKTHQPVTVLCVPIRHGADEFAEEYYYFEGMTRERALRDEEWWLIAYEAAKKYRGY